MEVKAMKYPIVIHKDQHSDYGILFPDLPGCFSAGSSIEEAMAIVLASLSLLGLGIFGPGIANGIVSGGPQLSAGAATLEHLAPGSYSLAVEGVAPKGFTVSEGGRTVVELP